MPRRLTHLVLSCALILAPRAALAGQLFIDEYPLAEAKKNESVYLAKIEKLDAKKGTLTFEIRRLWIDGKEVQEGKVTRFKEEVRKGTTWTSQFDEKVKIGAKLSVKVYQGVEWTDPNESPIERRLAGRAALADFKVGDELIVVGTDSCEVMKPSKEVFAELTGSGKAKR